MLAPAVLMFFILMDLTIAFLAFMMKTKGLESSIAVSIGMVALAIFSFVLLKLLLNARVTERLSD